LGFLVEKLEIQKTGNDIKYLIPFQLFQNHRLQPLLRQI